MNDEYSRPPGIYFDIVAHLKGIDKAIDIAVIQDHRFTFYFWYKWWKKIDRKLSLNDNKPPALITIDWHRDLDHPDNEEKQGLNNLDLNNYKEVALFSWDKLNSNNHSHILSAAHLNLIGDIYVLYKQDEDDESSFIDNWGNEHIIKCFNSPYDLYAALKNSNYNDVYFDIDLDYFTESKDLCGAGDDLTLTDEKNIITLLNPDSEMMKWIFERMSGMTIATEPEFCGGMSNSNKIYSIVDNIFFNPQLLSKHAKWKHLQ